VLTEFAKTSNMMVIQSEHEVLDTFRSLIMELVEDNQKLNEKALWNFNLLLSVTNSVFQLSS
jgi:hypothetical protein